MSVKEADKKKQEIGHEQDNLKRYAMIQSKEDLKRHLETEEKNYHKKWYYDLPILMTEQQILYKHARFLRKAEYAANNRKISRVWYLFRLLRIQTRYGISIPLNVLEEGFEMAHLGSVIINAGAHIGKNAKLHPGVCVGANHEKAPAKPRLRDILLKTWPVLLKTVLKNCFRPEEPKETKDETQCGILRQKGVDGRTAEIQMKSGV